MRTTFFCFFSSHVAQAGPTFTMYLKMTLNLFLRGLRLKAPAAFFFFSFLKKEIRKPSAFLTLSPSVSALKLPPTRRTLVVLSGSLRRA